MFIFVCLFLLIGCAGSVGIFSGESGHIYFVCVCVRCVECRAGTIFLVDFGGVGGGTVRIFFSFWPVRYDLVRERWSVFLLLSSVICPFFWRLGVGGKGFLCHIFFSGSS
jgi:hypothetical protein